MIKPIDMQVIVKNIDQVAKARKVDDQNIAAQQANAEANMNKNIKQHTQTVNKSQETEQNAIGKEEKKKNQEESAKEKKKHEEENHEKKRHKAKEPNKGVKLDIEI